MNKEQLIAKGIKHKFNGKETLFQVESLNKHFDGLVIHESDILTDEFEDQYDEYVKAGDVNFDSATPNKVDPEEEREFEEEPISIKAETIHGNQIVIADFKPTGMTFEEAEELLSKGKLVSLPEWEGFWFKNIKKDELLVFTKDGEILDTPFDEYKLRNDWVKAEPTPEQKEKLNQYFENLEINGLKVVDPVIESNKVENLEPVIPPAAAKEGVLKTEDIGLPKPKEKKAANKK